MAWYDDYISQMQFTPPRPGGWDVAPEEEGRAIPTRKGVSGYSPATPTTPTQPGVSSGVTTPATGLSSLPSYPAPTGVAVDRFGRIAGYGGTGPVSPGLASAMQRRIGTFTNGATARNRAMAADYDAIQAGGGTANAQQARDWIRQYGTRDWGR